VVTPTTPDPLFPKPPRSVSPRSRYFQSYDPDSPWLIEEFRQDRIINTLPIFNTNYTEADRILFANISEEYKAYLGDDLALDYVDPEFVDPPINTTNPKFSNSTDSHNLLLFLTLIFLTYLGKTFILIIWQTK
jgi:hypothetical protein